MKTELTDFTFKPSGFGSYLVTYQSISTFKEWTAVVEDMELIDRTKNSDSPKRKDLNYLKWYCKNN